MNRLETGLAARIVAAAQWLMLASIDADGSPAASYAPFAPLSDGLGIVVSRLAAHTKNLLEQPRAGVLLVDEVDESGRSYERARVSIDVHARAPDPGSETAARVWSALEARHGEIAATLHGLPDFTPFVLEPLRARLITGFAAAHDLDRTQTLAEIRAARQTREPR